MSTISRIPVSMFLRRVLLADALASGATGLAMAGGHAVLAEPLGLPAPLLLVAGLALLPYAWLIASLARRPQLRRAWLWAVIAVNAVWAVDSIGIMVLGWVQPTPLGVAFVAAQAVVVALFAELQWWALRRFAHVRDTGSAMPLRSGA